MPLRINIGARGIKNNEIELINRRTKDIQKVSVEKAFEEAVKWLEGQV